MHIFKTAEPPKSNSSEILGQWMSFHISKWSVKIYGLESANGDFVKMENAKKKSPKFFFADYEHKRPVGLSSFVNCPPVVASFLTQRQLSINAGWQHMGRVPHPNYVDPECCVATVCHQVRFMYWEHLVHFQRAISHLKWHKIVCMRYLACAFSQMKSTDMFSMYLQSGVPRHFIRWFITGWT